MITWNEKKAAIITAIEDHGYTGRPDSQRWTKDIDGSDMFCVVDLKTQPKPGMFIPVFLLHPDRTDNPEMSDPSGTIETAKHILREATNALESSIPETDKETELKDDHSTEAEPLPENVPIPRPQRPTPNMITSGTSELSIEIIQQYINPDLTGEQAYNFMQLCVASKLNPFLGEAHAIVFKGKASFVVGVGGNMRRAQEQSDYDGYQAGVIIMTKDNELKEREGTFMLETDTLVGGWCKVSRKNIKTSFVTKVALAEYIQRKADGTPNKIWATKPATMIVKVAKSQCHREAYMGINSGLYAQEEIQDLGDVEVIE